MSPEDENAALTLIKYIREDIRGATEKIDTLTGKVEDVKVATTKLKAITVTKAVCDDHHQQVNKKLYNISRELEKKQTKSNHLVATEDDLPNAKSLLTKIKDNIAAISIILGFIGLIGAGFYKLAHIMVNIEKTVNDSEAIKELRNEVKKLSNKPKIKYIK